MLVVEPRVRRHLAQERQREAQVAAGVRPQPGRSRFGERRQRAQLDRRERTQLDPAAREPPQRGEPRIRPRRHDHRCVRQPPQREDQRLEGRRVRPLRVVDEQHDLLVTEPFEQCLPGTRTCLLPARRNSWSSTPNETEISAGSPLTRSTRRAGPERTFTSAVLPTPAAPSTSANGAAPSAASSRSRPTKIASRAVTAARTLPPPLTRGAKQLEVFPVADARADRYTLNPVFRRRTCRAPFRAPDRRPAGPRHRRPAPVVGRAGRRRDLRPGGL